MRHRKSVSVRFSCRVVAWSFCESSIVSSFGQLKFSAMDEGRSIIWTRRRTVGGIDQLSSREVHTLSVSLMCTCVDTCLDWHPIAELCWCKFGRGQRQPKADRKKNNVILIGVDVKSVRVCGKGMHAINKAMTAYACFSNVDHPNWVELNRLDREARSWWVCLFCGIGMSEIGICGTIAWPNLPEASMKKQRRCFFTVTQCSCTECVFEKFESSELATVPSEIGETYPGNRFCPPVCFVLPLFHRKMEGFKNFGKLGYFLLHPLHGGDKKKLKLELDGERWHMQKSIQSDWIVFFRSPERRRLQQKMTVAERVLLLDADWSLSGCWGWKTVRYSRLVQKWLIDATKCPRTSAVCGPADLLV